MYITYQLIRYNVLIGIPIQYVYQRGTRNFCTLIQKIITSVQKITVPYRILVYILVRILSNVVLDKNNKIVFGFLESVK